MYLSKVAAALLGLSAGAVAGGCASRQSGRQPGTPAARATGVPGATQQLTPAPQCRVSPSRRVIRLPARGFAWLPGEPDRGSCDVAPPHGWTPQPAGSRDPFVYADGPEGSGRYWTVVVGAADSSGAEPTRGACLRTSTVGWRTLQRFDRLPLPWRDDLNRDGVAELIVWESFPLRDGASAAEFGLAAWVYRQAAPDSLVVDWALSREMAREIARAYRAPLAASGRSVQALRTSAAEALEALADGRCRP
jgi:hypothetical protein